MAQRLSELAAEHAASVGEMSCTCVATIEGATLQCGRSDLADQCDLEGMVP